MRFHVYKDGTGSEEPESKFNTLNEAMSCCRSYSADKIPTYIWDDIELRIILTYD